MEEDRDKFCSDHHIWRNNRHREVYGGIYGMAFIGALVYYIQHATTFWFGVVGFFKALFWPAMLIYKILELLKM